MTGHGCDPKGRVVDWFDLLMETKLALEGRCFALERRVKELEARIERVALDTDPKIGSNEGGPTHAK